FVSVRQSRIHAKDCAECETKDGMLDRMDVEIGLSGALTSEQRAKLMEIAGRCPVHRTLKSEINIRLRTAPTGLLASNRREQDSIKTNSNEEISTMTASDAAKAVVRRNTEEVQGKGRFDIFEELFADDFVDHTPQPNMTPDKAGVRKLYGYIRHAFPDFHPKIHWQLADGDRVITYKTYYGTHEGDFLGIAPTHRKIHFETVDVMRVRDGKITDQWGV